MQVPNVAVYYPGLLMFFRRFIASATNCSAAWHEVAILWYFAGISPKLCLVLD